MNVCREERESLGRIVRCLRPEGHDGYHRGRTQTPQDGVVSVEWSTKSADRGTTDAKGDER